MYRSIGSRFSDLPVELSVGPALLTPNNDISRMIQTCTYCHLLTHQYSLCENSHILCSNCIPPARESGLWCLLCNDATVGLKQISVPLKVLKEFKFNCACGFIGTLAEIRGHLKSKVITGNTNCFGEENSALTPLKSRFRNRKTMSDEQRMTNGHRKSLKLLSELLRKTSHKLNSLATKILSVEEAFHENFEPLVTLKGDEIHVKFCAIIDLRTVYVPVDVCDIPLKISLSEFQSELFLDIDVDKTESYGGKPLFKIHGSDGAFIETEPGHFVSLPELLEIKPFVNDCIVISVIPKKEETIFNNEL